MYRQGEHSFKELKWLTSFDTPQTFPQSLQNDLINQEYYVVRDRTSDLGQENWNYLGSHSVVGFIFVPTYPTWMHSTVAGVWRHRVSIQESFSTIELQKGPGYG